MSPFKAPLILLACLSIHHGISAQNIDRAGYYIDLKGDTVRGTFSNYADNETSPSQVRFHPSSASEVTLTPGNCRTFKVTNYETYISFTGNRMLNATNYLEADADTSDKFEPVTIFIRELFNSSPYRLYQLHDRKRDNFYLSENNGPLTELSYKEYGTQDSLNGLVAKPSDVYKRQLFALSTNGSSKGDPRQVITYIEKMNFSDKDIVTVLTLLTGQKPPKRKHLEFPPQLFIGAGLSFNSFNVSGDPTFSDFEVGSYSSQTTPVFEVGAKLYSQRHGGRLFVMGRVNYYKYLHTRYFYQGPYSVNDTTTHSATVISIPISLGYRLVPGKALSVEPSIGVRAAILSNNNNIQARNIGPAEKVGVNQSFGFGAFAELALTVMKRASLVADYNFPINTTTSTAYSADYSSFTLGLRYFIF